MPSLPRWRPNRLPPHRNKGRPIAGLQEPGSISIAQEREIVLSVKKLTAAASAAALILGAGISVAATGTANAVTPSCGHDCVALFSHNFGTFPNPNFVLDVYKQGQKVGQPIILFRTSNTDPAEDFTVSAQGTVNDFFNAGLVSAAVNLHYGCVVTSTHSCTQPDGTVFRNLEAWELEYAPFGADTGLCTGVASTAVSGEGVTLQPCGVSAKTVWIVDTLDSPFSFSVPLISASDTNFSHPFVATYPASSFPTDKPRPQLFTSNLTGESNGAGPVLGTVDDNQMWAIDTGVLH